jgi:pimeloyl-ACP methyl ester carboxylesterase
MPRALIDGVRIAYHEWPDRGPVPLCVHGMTANCHAWDLWAERLAPAFRVIALDLTPYQRAIRAPTLILQAPGGMLGDSDAIMAREEGERVAAAIPDARLVTVPGANHYSILFGPDPTAYLEAGRFLSG